MGRQSKDERRDKILESTWKLIARDGLGATNMRGLAAEAGYANGALAYYFEGKEELLRAAFEYVLNHGLAEQLVRVAAARYASGAGTQADALRAEIEVARLNAEIGGNAEEIVSRASRASEWSSRTQRSAGMPRRSSAPK